MAWQAAALARQAAERLDEPLSLAVSAYGTALSLLAAGAFDLASHALAAVELPLVTSEDMQVAGSLALASSLIAAAENDPAWQDAALEHAADLAERTGEGNALAFGFGPSNVGVWRMQGALEVGDHAEAAHIAREVNPAALTVRARRAVYWREYGRALARLPRRHDEAVTMLRRAEQLSPEHVHWHPFTRSLLAELVPHAKRDARCDWPRAMNHWMAGTRLRTRRGTPPRLLTRLHRHPPDRRRAHRVRDRPDAQSHLGPPVDG